MRIILTKPIATEYLGAVPVGTGMDVSVSYGELLITRGFARLDEAEGETSDDGIIQEFADDGADAGCEWPTVAEDSGSGSDGADGPAE